MANFELEYTEVDGLLYPHIEINGKTELDDLGKYGLLRLHYLYERKQQMYHELLLTGKLAGHCASIDKTAFELAERIRVDYLRKHPMPEDDTMERIRIPTQAQMVVDEIITAEVICI